MKYTCALCGRATHPFVFIGLAAVGPKCAQRAGLTPAKKSRGSLLRFAGKAPKALRHDPQTLDLFSEQ